MQFKKMAAASAAMLMALSLNLHAEEAGYAAKSLFFGEDGDVKAVATGQPAPETVAQSDKPAKAVVVATAPKKPAEKSKASAKRSSKELPMGAAYFVRLKKPDASTEDVLATRTFATGDKFQLGLKVNRPSFVYIFNEEPGGRISMLHPRPGATAMVDAMGTVFLPAQGNFQFEGNAGLEKLLVLMSEEELFQPDATLQKIQPDLVTQAVFEPAAVPGGMPVNSLAAAPGAGCAVVTADAGTYASKAIVYAQDAGAGEQCNVAGAAPAYASKAIVFADDPRPAAGQQVASYVVKPKAVAAKEPLLLKIQLMHR